MTKLEEVLERLVEVLAPPAVPAVVDHRTHPEGRSMAKQAFAEEADINLIMSRYESAGVVPRMNSRSPQWGDFSGVEDYHTACLRVIEAQAAFDALPAAVRAAFENDPEQLIAAIDDPARRDDLVKLGLFEAPKAEAEKPAEPVPAPVDSPEGVRGG